MREFSKAVINQLKYYVYALYVPGEELPFYIGKGKGNRVFAHIEEAEKIKNNKDSLSTQELSEKNKIITEILESGREPVVEILRHGLEDEKEALVAEAVAIDLLMNSLSNKQLGHKSRQYGRKDLNRILHEYDEEYINIIEEAILIKINKYYNPETQIVELYDRVRSAWFLNKERASKAKYVFAIYQSKILEVYRVAAWIDASLTIQANCANAIHIPNTEKKRRRIEFVGQLAENEMRKKYCGKHIKNYEYGSQNPCSYRNI